MKTTGSNGRKLASFLTKTWGASEESFIPGEQAFYNTSHFHHMLGIEWKRTMRSERPFLLMLLDLTGLQSTPRFSDKLEKIKEAIVSCSRETDISGWYESKRVLGTIFTEMSSVDNGSIEKISRKMKNRISETLGEEWARRIQISLHVIRFPEANI